MDGTNCVADATRESSASGFGEKNDWRAEKIRLDKNGATFRVDAPQGGI